jgi:DNA invertase Pin-like site-specific DNA recombinase
MLGGTRARAANPIPSNRELSMNGSEKILPEHRERMAYVYARQSTPIQLLQNHTSTERQIELTQLATALGWLPTKVELIADDLGRSGKFSENRVGFQRLVAEVSLGRVGAVFSLDAASRLARSSADWHRLLEIASFTRTLLVDEQNVYDPRDPNDRLILGMKGTMADFELVWLRQRMEGGRWHLAKKGAYQFRPPVGYLWSDNHLIKDPDEEIRRAIELCFERYRVSSSVREVAKYFVDHALRLPSRFGSRVVWKLPTMSHIAKVLHNPLYTGTYVYGRGRTDTILLDGVRRQRRTERPMGEWTVVIRDAHPAYISWEEFVANQKRMAENGADCSKGGSRRAAREGPALLQGILMCGRCSDRMHVRYLGQDGRYGHYFCSGNSKKVVGYRCVHLAQRNIDGPVVELVLNTLTRSQLSDSTKILDIIEQEDAALDQQWKLRIERARYETKRAERQYDACDPENRVVARTLETRWNEKLLELERLEREHEELRQRKRVELTDLDRRRILELADDLPRLWSAKATTDRDRKMLLRLLIQQVSVNTIDVPQPGVRIKILWHTGALSELEANRPGTKDPKHRRKIEWRLITTEIPKSSAEAS